MDEETGFGHTDSFCVAFFISIELLVWLESFQMVLRAFLDDLFNWLLYLLNTRKIFLYCNRSFPNYY